MRKKIVLFLFLLHFILKLSFLENCFDKHTFIYLETNFKQLWKVKKARNGRWLTISRGHAKPNFMSTKPFNTALIKEKHLENVHQKQARE